MKQLVTIGVYGADLDRFLAALAAEDVRLLLDVRQRRGVRGSQYAWANAARLQASLADARIGYRHCRGLAPTTELRQLQYAEDDRLGATKRTRTLLAPAYVDRYCREILDTFDLRSLLEALPDDGATALFCVERESAACHRSLIAARLVQAFGLALRDVQP